MNIPHGVSLTLMALLFACCGCGGTTYPVAKVSGKVTKAGKPVAGASVSFQPIASSPEGGAGPGSNGITDEHGRYVLRTFKEKADGAVIGRHRVMISLPLPPGVPDDGVVDPSLLAPLKFRDGSTEIEIPDGGLEAADFKLD